MGLFTTTPKIITEREAKELENRLYGEHGFNQKKIGIVRELIAPHLHDAERYGDPKGVSEEEVKEIKSQLQENLRKHLYSQDLTEPEVDAVDKLLDDYLTIRK